MKDSLSRKQTIFHCLLLRSLNPPDILHKIYSRVIEIETEEARQEQINALYIHLFKKRGNYCKINFPEEEFSPYIPIGRGIEWVIKHNDQLRHDKPRCETLALLSLLDVPGLFVVQVWGTDEYGLTSYPVTLRRNIIKYINKICKKNEFEELLYDYEVYLQTGLPIDIYS